MPKENETEGADLSQQNGSDQSADESQQNNGQQDDGQQSDDQQEGQSQEDYRGKLNATNRFLEREGYEHKDGRWQKKPEAPRQNQQPPQGQQSATPALSRDEAILFARGLSVEQVEKAKKIAAIEEVGLLEAVETDIYQSWKTQKDREAKDAAAQLGVSKGAKTVTKKGFNTPGLSDEDHKALFQDKVGK